jgi:hypothetical protein
MIRMPTMTRLAALAAAAPQDSGLLGWVRDRSAVAGVVLVAVLLVLLLTIAWWREGGGPPAPWVRPVATVSLLLLLDLLAIVVVIRFLVLA